MESSHQAQANSNKIHNNPTIDKDEEYIDITNLIRQCATQCLSYSHPFTPLAKVECGGGSGGKDGDNTIIDDEVGITDGSLLNGLHVRGTSIAEDGASAVTVTDADQQRQHGTAAAAASTLTPLDLQDAMTALELGDKRMDGCEIVFPPTRNLSNNGELTVDSGSGKRKEEGTNGNETVTFPPRIAPTSLSDGTPTPAPTPAPTTCTINHKQSGSKQEHTPSLLSGDTSLNTNNNNNTLQLPNTPCPSLLPYWNTLSLNGNNDNDSQLLLPLLLLQLTALEAYIGTHNGGSNAAETLYCMLWFHDGVLVDMNERLTAMSSSRSSSSSSHEATNSLVGGVGANGGRSCMDVEAGVQHVEQLLKQQQQQQQQQNDASGRNGGTTTTPTTANTTTLKEIEADELTVAQWTLFASSLGVVRIAEAVRWVVVNADFYEEEDFGVALHGAKAKSNHSQPNTATTHEGVEEVHNIVNQEGNDTVEDNKHDDSKDQQPQKEEEGQTSSSMRFCPKLEGSQYIEVVWDTALSYLRLYRTSCKAKGDKLKNPTIDALETILKMQQSFFQAIKILSNLSDETVVDFTNIAVNKSRETVCLMERLRDNSAVSELSKSRIVAIDGQLLQRKPMNDEKTQEMHLLLSASFDPFVNRRLLGNAPVRKACFRNPSDVVSSLSLIANELEWGVCDPILYGNSFGRITRMFERNSLRGCGGVIPKGDDPSKGKDDAGCLETEQQMGMSIIARSLIVLNLYFDDKLFGQHDFSEMVGQHMRQQSASPELLVQSTTADGGLPWLTRMAKPMYDILKALCLNRHRERGFIETLLLPAFQLLQYEAASLDEKFRTEHGLDARTTPAYATNYIILNTIRLMERYVGLGVELGLYPNWYDLSTALWYRDFLLSAFINVKGSIEREKKQRREMEMRIKLEQEEEERNAKAQLQLQQNKKKGKAKKGKKSKPPSPSPTPSAAAVVDVSAQTTEEDFEDRVEYSSLLLHRNLCRGLVRYIAALCQAGFLPDPPASINMFTTHKKRFEKRFEAFSTLPQPPGLCYDDYIRGSDFSSVQSAELLASASECFRSGKGVVDWLLDVVVAESVDDRIVNKIELRKDNDLYISIRREEIMALAKVCVTNSLFLHKLSSAVASGKKSESYKVALDFKAHKQYCTLSIV